MKVISLIKSEDDLKKFKLMKYQDLQTKEDHEKYENYMIGDEECYVYGILNYLNKNQKYYFLKYGSILATYKSDFFDIVDSKISKFWRTKKYEIGEHNIDALIEITGFPELANNLNFLGNLYDWEETEEAIFEKYQLLMYLEFPDENISEKGILLLEPNWIQCPKCDYPWQEEGDLAMLKCSECGNIMHNPLYFKDIGK